MAYGSFAQPPAASWADPSSWGSAINSGLGKNSNLLLGLGAGLLSGNLGALPQSIATGSQADSAYAASKKADAERLDGINKTAAWLRQNYPQFADLPPNEGFQLAASLMAKEKASGPAPTTDMQNYEYGLTHPDFNTYQTQKGGAAETALQPTWGIDNDPNSPTYGQKILGQLNKAGKFVRTAMPEGVTALDPVDLQGQKAGVTVDAKSAAAARAALPGAQQAFDLANKAADSLLNDTTGMADQFGNTLGVPHQMVPDWATLPGSDMARFRAELAQGQGNAFLQARQVLKGAGQVTDYEGAKAEAAYSRMALAAQKNNQEEFIAAVRDFKDAVAEGYQKLQAAAQGEYARGGPGITGTAPAAGGFQILSVE